MHSLLLVQTSKQIISYEINENLVEVPLGRVIPCYTGKCHKCLKNCLKAAVLFIVGEQSIYCSFGKFSCPRG